MEIELQKKWRGCKKAQVSMEVMIYIAFFMLMFVFFTLFIISSFNADIQKREFMLARATVNQVGDYAKFVLDGGPGFSAKFNIQEEVNGEPYRLRFVSSGWIYADVEGRDGEEMSFAYPIGFGNFTLPGGGYSHEYNAGGVHYTVVEVYSSSGAISFNYITDEDGTRIEVDI
ncbi:MAG: hypothetical protein ABIH83_01175 [Candidatus Micrarchaeota archaeon]